MIISFIVVKISFGLFLFFVSSLLSAQDVISIKNGESYKAERVNAFLHDLHSSNDYVISFRLKLTDRIDERSDYFVLTKKGDDLSAYNYLKKTNRLEPLHLSKESLKLAWRTFIQNDLFTMQNEKDIPNFCPEKYNVYNSYTYEFVLLTKDTMKTLSYYDPEYYDNACYGMPERKKIINSVSVVSHILSR